MSGPQVETTGKSPRSGHIGLQDPMAATKEPRKAAVLLFRRCSLENDLIVIAQTKALRLTKQFDHVISLDANSLPNSSSSYRASIHPHAAAAHACGVLSTCRPPGIGDTLVCLCHGCSHFDFGVNVADELERVLVDRDGPLLTLSSVILCP
ncbi:hypothetical protein BHM03_00043019 [Ensete ventricosum]|nr:hypothetical protein BHM03_00043019 [Ensete ventricosum]